jgi:uncharacterized membrane-anchored protein YitT (DUF2179 family)
MDPRLNLCRRWLMSAAYAAAAFGLALGLFNQTSAFDVLLNAHVDPIFWGSVPKAPAIVRFQQFTYSVIGAMLCGWGMLIASIAGAAFAPANRWLRRSLTLSLLVWYLLDTAISLGMGVFWNAALNTAFLLALGTPLVLAGRISTRGGDT